MKRRAGVAGVPELGYGGSIMEAVYADIYDGVCIHLSLFGGEGTTLEEGRMVGS